MGDRTDHGMTVSCERAGVLMADSAYEAVKAENERLREALEALVFYAPDGGSIDYVVSDFAIAVLRGATVDEAARSGNPQPASGSVSTPTPARSQEDDRG